MKALRMGDTATIKTHWSAVIPVLLTSRIQGGHIHSYVSMFYPARLLSHVQCLTQNDFSRSKNRIVKTAKFSLVLKSKFSKSKISPSLIFLNISLSQKSISLGLALCKPACLYVLSKPVTRFYGVPVGENMGPGSQKSHGENLVYKSHRVGKT